jgi:transcriptional regulator, Spx/MgsR family
MKPQIYGIPSCDSIRKARKWFDANNVEYTFSDVRQQCPSRAQVASWIEAVGAKALINKRSTTWKNMDESARQEVEQGDTLGVLLANPTLIKRPVLEYQGEIAVGFSADDYAQRFNTHG